MKLIGIHGKARSGKDSIAEHLWIEYAFTRIAFADPLKRGAQVMFGLSEAQLMDDALKETVIDYWGLSPRQIFQHLGTEAMRGTFGSDIWVKRWLISYNFLKDTDHIVVPDVRFDNEADVIRENGGVIIQVVRGDGLSGSTAAHVSESGLSKPADFVIYNDSNLQQLGMKVDEILEDL